ncbi:50S ribosomal protein L13 [Candidatus Woesearchaeota archaeon]|nr:50S ribosomal protein L13 [Candidatus Woesearchaeota archaeon]
MIVNADSAILGRLATKISKELLKGENIVVINSEKIVISGNPKAVFKKFHEKRKIGDPHKGPFYPRYPDRMFKRVVRGMLPYKKERGKKALRKLKVCIGNPDDLKGEKISKTSDDLRSKFITLEQLCKRLGAKLG